MPSGPGHIWKLFGLSEVHRFIHLLRYRAITLGEGYRQIWLLRLTFVWGSAATLGFEGLLNWPVSCRLVECPYASNGEMREAGPRTARPGRPPLRYRTGAEDLRKRKRGSLAHVGRALQDAAERVPLAAL